MQWIIRETYCFMYHEVIIMLDKFGLSDIQEPAVSYFLNSSNLFLDYAHFLPKL